MKLLIALMGLAYSTAGLPHTNLEHFRNVNADFVFPINSDAQTGHITRFSSGAINPQQPTSLSAKVSAHKSCIFQNHQTGICKRLVDCDPLTVRLLRNPSNVTFINELRISNMICDHEYAVICCPFIMEEALKIFPENSNVIPKGLPSMQDGCGYATTSEIIRPPVVGGVPSEIGAWPWIALIGYNDSRAVSPFKCGGTLITSRHVITAAHCIKSNLAFVRLGEHDLTIDNETNHIDITVSKVLKHRNYNSVDGHSDIALLYLNQNVQFSSKITPICLPETKELNFLNKLPYVAGWGKTAEGGKPSEDLQELPVPIHDNSVCKDLYQKQNKLISQRQFDDAVLCAGDLEGGKDTCQGDSGGPLMKAERFGDTDRFQLIGVVSYGIGCARSDSPGVYTKVGYFIDWIESAVKDVSLFEATHREMIEHTNWD